MSTHDDLTADLARDLTLDLGFAVTHEVRDRCLCLHLQRAARSVARRFDDALRPVGLTSGQFSLLMSLNRADAPRVGEVAALLAMDRTTLTANLKPLARRRLLKLVVDKDDRRSRRLHLTDAGRALLRRAVTIWRRENRSLERTLTAGGATRLRGELAELGYRSPGH
jgi:DNA-binding MarR family transcriptional regulator